MRLNICLLFASIISATTQAHADSASPPTMPPTLVRSGISLSNTCFGVNTQTLTRRLALEILSDRERRPGSHTNVALSCSDVLMVMKLHRPKPEPVVTREFTWQGHARRQPERWLALAIHQSLLDAGIVESIRNDGPQAPVSVGKPEPPLALRSPVVNLEIGWRAMGIGEGWSGPSVAMVSVVGRQSLAWLFRIGYAQGQSRRQLGYVQVRAFEAVNALTIQRPLTPKALARVWAGGGVIQLNMQGVSGAASVSPSKLFGLGALFNAGMGVDWMAWKRLTLGMTVAGGYVVGGAKGQVRGEASVNSAGPWVGVALTAGVAL